jgi:hypothetical protein
MSAAGRRILMLLLLKRDGVHGYCEHDQRTAHERRAAQQVARGPRAGCSASARLPNPPVDDCGSGGGVGRVRRARVVGCAWPHAALARAVRLDWDRGSAGCSEDVEPDAAARQSRRPWSARPLECSATDVEPVAGGGEPIASGGEPIPGSREPVPGSGEPIAGNVEPVTGGLCAVAGSRASGACAGSHAGTRCLRRFLTSGCTGHDPA